MGNLHQLLLMFSENNTPMKEWLSRRDYLSPDIANELITIMGQCVLGSILAKVKAGYGTQLSLMKLQMLHTMKSCAFQFIGLTLTMIFMKMCSVSCSYQTLNQKPCSV